jgi:succinate dehydrogenase / fumarate reductase membrane anchor subunit
MLLFLVIVLARFAADTPSSYEAWRNWIGAAGMRIAILLFVAAVLLHAWVGLRDVAMDYVHPPALRIGVLALVGAGLAAAGAWMALVLVAL